MIAGPIGGVCVATSKHKSQDVARAHHIHYADEGYATPMCHTSVSLPRLSRVSQVSSSPSRLRQVPDEGQEAAMFAKPCLIAGGVFEHYLMTT